MPNFSQQIPGEPEPRSFRFDVAEQALYTDMNVEDPVGGMAKQEQAKITVESAKTNPQHELYWTQTSTYREAYRLCEEEGLSLEDALATVNGQEVPYTPLPIRAESEEVNNEHPNRRVPEPEGLDAEPEETSLLTGVAMKELLLINQIALILLDPCVDEADKIRKVVEFLRAKTEEINTYEIVI